MLLTTSADLINFYYIILLENEACKVYTSLKAKTTKTLRKKINIFEGNPNLMIHSSPIVQIHYLGRLGKHTVSRVRRNYHRATEEI